MRERDIALCLSNQNVMNITLMRPKMYNLFIQIDSTNDDFVL